LVITDTSIWIDYLRTRRSSLGDELAKLIDDGRAALAGMVLAELLRGLRKREEQERLERQLSGATYLEMSRAAWHRAGILGAHLDSRGQPLPIADILIASLALEGDHEVFTNDRHFERIPGLKLYQMEGAADD
jgi:predicted nucleic acid-binding protein